MKVHSDGQLHIGNKHSRRAEKIKYPGFPVLEKMNFLCEDEKQMAVKAAKRPGLVILRKLSQKDIAIAQGIIKECHVKIKRLTDRDIDRVNRRGHVDIGTQTKIQCGVGYMENEPVIQLVDELMARFDQLEKVLKQKEPRQDFVRIGTGRISDEFEPVSANKEPMEILVRNDSKQNEDREEIINVE